MKAQDIHLVWIRRDLRITDHTALFEATKNDAKVVLVFVFDTKILNLLPDKEDQRVDFIFQSLCDLNKQLEKYDTKIIIRHGDPIKEIPYVAQELGVTSVYFNEDYEPYAKARDQEVKGSLTKLNIKSFSFRDHIIFGSQILKPDQTPYVVYTPYKNTWLKKLKPLHWEEKRPQYNFVKVKDLKGLAKKITLREIGFSSHSTYYKSQNPSRSAAIQRLKEFSQNLSHYKENRDFPALDEATSLISPFLRFGLISVRECLRTIVKLKNEGARTWMSELIWREFFIMIMDMYPHVVNSSFKIQYKNLKWENNKEWFDKWKSGNTGFPIVDAGMRQLNKTGWMHNRVRMIVASFLVKDLLIDRRWGEQYFAEKLIDFELASNNGNWQWCASTGCDAQPYFRIFNPSLQSERFDKNAEYIKFWIPELSQISPKEIHHPEDSDLQNKSTYPKPIISHSVQKQKALRLFNPKK
ncbi:MAG: deoxyribodipyrimidine photo-lyase [Bdellovibrionales bacterium]|nr:deoxyribodipyrimidine photo-lyase [Bdellovibrionales bacterium]